MSAEVSGGAAEAKFVRGRKETGLDGLMDGKYNT